MIEARGAMQEIPPKANHIREDLLSHYPDRDCKTIEHMFCGFNDCSRITTEYDRLALKVLVALQV